MISVVIAEDQAAVRDGLITILEHTTDIAVVAAVSDGAAAVRAIRAHHPDILLLDLHMPIMTGLETVTALRDVSPPTRILVLTTYGDQASISKALVAGAHGFITKADGAAQILAAIRAVAAGHSAFGAEATRYLLDSVRHRHELQRAATKFGLTEQEARILQLIATGYRNADIAKELVVTVATVKTHINNIFAKLGVESRQQAIRMVSDDEPSCEP